jgi:serine/threonine-protein kinase
MTDRSATDPERLRRLYALIDHALDVPEAERDAWLESLDESARPLVPRLRELLARSGVETDAFMRRPAAARLQPHGADDSDADEAVHDDTPGDRVGPYRLIEPIAAGGMATVWLAETDDGTLRRHVALKLPRVDWSASLAPRMARERNLLAALEHPNIARLYDAGVTAQGRPWLAMERVHGEPIDRFVTEHALDVPSILRLVLQVCDALAHAHARLIVHRDLKPANILVTLEGDVRLVDFGIAKLLHDSEGADDRTRSLLTRQHGGALTLDYASPEQLAGKPLTVATDVYSLGVVLYELLTGQRPYRLRRDSNAALEEAILAGDMAPASSRCTVATRARALRGDLDAVLAKALARNTVRRYTGIASLAADLQAHLDGRPVQAQPPSIAYRSAKFVRRHRVPMVAAVLVAMSLVGGLAGTWIQARRAQQQADIAQRERDLALEQLRSAEAAGDQLHMALSAAASRSLTSSELAAVVEQQVASRYAADPALRSRLLLRLAVLQAEIEATDDAQRLTAAAHEAAVEARDDRLVAHADCHAAIVAAYLGRTAEAVSLSRRAREALSPATHANEPLRLDCHSWSSSVHLLAADYDEAETQARAGLALVGAGSPGRERVAADLNTALADVLGQRGRFAEALAHYRQARAQVAALGLAGTATDDLQVHNLAYTLARAGQPLRAVEGFDELASRHRANGKAMSPVTLVAHANTLNQLERFDAALAMADQAFEGARQAGNTRALARIRLARATALCSVAANNACTAAADEAQATLSELPNIFQGTVDVLRALHDLEHGRVADAAGHAAAARAKAEGGATADPGVVRAWIVDARVALRQGRLDDARDAADRAASRARVLSQGLTHADYMGHAASVQAQVAAARGDTAGAHAAWQEALAHLEPALGTDAPSTRRARRAGR